MNSRRENRPPEGCHQKPYGETGLFAWPVNGISRKSIDRPRDSAYTIKAVARTGIPCPESDGELIKQGLRN